MNDQQTRLVLIGLGLVLVAIIAIAVVISPDTEEVELPAIIESISPRPGDAVLSQANVIVDVQPGYAVELWVDDRLIAADEIAFVEATGVYAWSPGPGRTIEEWLPGPHEVLITWDRVAGLPDRGEFSWQFRVQ